MKRYLAAICVLAFAFSVVYSQKLIIPEKKLYEATDGKVYIQKGLPVYLRIGTSPNDAQNTVRLNSEATSAYANPMYFDTEGFNSFRSPSAVDTVTKKVVYPKRDIIFEVYADSHPPVTSIQFEDSKVYKKNGIFYVNGNILLKLSAKDELSGVDKIMYSIDSSAYQEYSSPVKLNDEKSYIFKYYSFDHVGNVENLKQCLIRVDRTKPKTALEIKGDQSDNIVSGKTLIMIKSSPDSSGIARIVIKLDDHPEHTYSGPINTAALSEGDHKLTYYGVDNVGNEETPHEYSFFVDRTPPTILQDIIGKSFLVNGKEYSSGQSVLKLTTIDNKAGVKEVYYSINKGKFKLYEKPVMLASARGSLSVRAYAVDKVNNRSDVNDNAGNAKIPYIDLSGPAMSYQLTGPVFISGDTTFISKFTKIYLKAFDDESGLNNIRYSIDKSDPVTYQGPFSIEKEGIHTIEYTGTDNVDNTTTSSFKLMVDNTGPVIYPRFSTLPTATVMEDNTKIEVYPPHADLFVAATDIASGYDHMTYSINGVPEKLFNGFISGFGAKNSITVKAYDKLGNETTANVVFEIKN